MSRERDLLRKILDETNYINYACNDKIRNEMQELLSQPEQAELLEILESKYRGNKMNKDRLIEVLETALAELKTEPLSEEKMIELWNTCHSAKKFARAIEKAHGIGVE